MTREDQLQALVIDLDRLIAEVASFAVITGDPDMERLIHQGLALLRAGADELVEALELASSRERVSQDVLS